MQKVLVSAGAVGAAALELNNNQATEVAEAAPHGVQQRRRSQAKKEEPAVLIQRSLAQHKASGKRVSTGRNAGVVWAWIGGIALVALVLFFGLYFGLQDDCPDVDKDAQCGKQPNTICDEQSITLDEAKAQEIRKEKCTCLAGNLIIPPAFFALSSVGKTVKFPSSLIEIAGDFTVTVSGASTVEKLDTVNLKKVGGRFLLGGVAGEGKSFTQFNGNCIQEVGGNVDSFNMEYIQQYQLNKLSKAAEVNFVDHGKTSLNPKTVKLNALVKATKVFIDVNDGSKDTSFQFKNKKAEIGELFLDLAVSCGDAKVSVQLSSEAIIDVGKVENYQDETKAAGGLVRIGSKNYVENAAGLDKAKLQTSGGLDLVWIDEVASCQ